MKPLQHLKSKNGAQRPPQQLRPENGMPAEPQRQRRALMSKLIKKQQAEELRRRRLAFSNQEETEIPNGEERMFAFSSVFIGFHSFLWGLFTSFVQDNQQTQSSYEVHYLFCAFVHSIAFSSSRST